MIMDAYRRMALMALIALLGYPATAPAGGDAVISADAAEQSGADGWLHQRKLTLTGSPNDAFAQGYILVLGQGLPKPGVSPAQQRLTALRAAEVAAYRRLAEVLEGVAVEGKTTVRDCALADDTVNAAVKGFVRGAHKVYEAWDPKEGLAIVLMQVGMRGSDGVAELMYKQYVNTDTGRASLQLAAYTPLPSALPQPVPPASPPAEEQPVNHDGLVVDARELDFRPALINRILTSQGEALYDPSKISQKILVEQGAGEYTNTLEKARAALETRGSRTPLVIKASGLKSPSDLVVSSEDAGRIFTNDQRANFLASARVAFVLK